MKSLHWRIKHRGWWEAEGSLYSYRAVQENSSSWHLMVFKDGLEAELKFPVTLEDCRYYAAQIETGRSVLRSGRLVRSAS